MAPRNSHDIGRARRFSYAVITSIASKVSTAGVQIVALPIAAAALGTHGFALYSLLAAAVGWLALANLSIGPGLGVRLAGLRVVDSPQTTSEVFSSGFFLNLILVMLVGAAAMGAIWNLPVHEWFGPAYIQDKDEIRYGLTALVVFFIVQSSLAPVEAAQTAYQNQHVLNIVAAAGGLCCIFAVIATAAETPSPVSLIVAMNSPTLLARVGNAVAFVARNSALFPRPSGLNKTVCRELATSGLTYSLAGTAGHFLSHIFPVLVIGRNFAPDTAGAFAATMNAIILASGVLSMVTTPMWPAIADSIARGDREWARRAYGRLLGATLLFGTMVAVVFSTFGTRIFDVWFRGHIQPHWTLLTAAGLYFLASSWEVAHFMTLVGLNRIKTASTLMFLRSVVGTVAVLSMGPVWNAAGPFAAMTAAIIVIDMLPLRRLTLAALSGR